MPLPGPTHIPPIGEQTDPDKVRVAAVVGGQLASAPARGFGLTSQELGTLMAVTAGYPVTAQTRNRVVNPAMQISQENGNTTGTTNGYFAADQWFTAFITSAGTITTQRVQSVTPNGSKDRHRVTITVADASLAAGEFLYIGQNIEGNRIADFRYGGASAKQAILRFGFKGPAGVYAVSLENSVGNRSYVVLFTISVANTDTQVTLVIPGDTTGTWLTDTSLGFRLAITLACGSTYQGATGWQAGNILGTSGVSNGMGTASAVYELYDVGLYLDPLNTGVAPAWQMPDEAQELAACMRYYQKLGPINYYMFPDVPIASTLRRITNIIFPTPFRTTPTVTATLSGGTSVNFAFTATNIHAYAALTDASVATASFVLNNVIAQARM